MVNGVDEPVFLDTKLLVYANVAESPVHDAALAAIETRYEVGIELWISRQVLREFLAVLSRPQRFHQNPKPISNVIERVRFFRRHFHVAEDGPAYGETPGPTAACQCSAANRFMTPTSWPQMQNV